MPIYDSFSHSKSHDVDNSEIADFIEERIKFYQKQMQVTVKQSFLRRWQALIFSSKERAMFSVLSEKDANLGIFGNDICALYLGVADDILSLEELEQKQGFEGINIAEWVMVSSPDRPKTAQYLQAFSKYGLKPYGQMIWNSYQGRIANCFILNSDFTRHFAEGEK
ncbi:MAG: hypothetical protein QNJ47_05405 [Nostocaceae cyanobacterium]|nr:hypothetical protein [Nostocaceae cyanobacterium]